MHKSVEFWNRMSGKYDAGVHKKYRESYRKTIDKSLKYMKKSDICLDFACGTGITTIELAPKVKQVSAIDISEKMIVLAREKAKKSGIENIDFKVADLFDSELIDHSYDVIMAFNILYFVESIPAVLARISDLLKDDGYFISVTDCLGESKRLMTKMQHWLSKFGVIPQMKMLTTTDLLHYFKICGFKILEKENLYTSPPNYFIVAVK